MLQKLWLLFSEKLIRGWALRTKGRLKKTVWICVGGDGASDQDPFLAFSTQSHYGNIIVNVNNGVQCVGGSSIDTGFQRDKPPPYSEVVNKTEVPPPPYSTIDRANLRRQNGGGDGASTSGVGLHVGSGAGLGGMLPSSGSGVAVVGPPLAHPARQQYLQRNSTGHQDPARNAPRLGSASASGSAEQGPASERNSTASDGAASAESRHPATVALPLPPPPPPPPMQQPLQSQNAPAAPVPPPRSTSIMDSEAVSPRADPPPPPPPLPPRSDPLPASPAITSPCVGGGNLVVQEGKIVLTSSMARLPSPSSSLSPTASNSTTSTPAASSADRDFTAPSLGKLEVHQGQIVLNMVPAGTDVAEESSPHGTPGGVGSGCELQVKDGKITFKR